MAYTAWSVVFGEQPTAAKWNQLGENDAGFKDGTNFDNDIILAQHIANGQVKPDHLDLDPLTAYVATSQTTTSDVYADLATVLSVTVTVGANGLLLVLHSVRRASGSTTSMAEHASIALSGANTHAATDDDGGAYVRSTTTAAEVAGMHGHMLFSGLNAGVTTVTQKYRDASGGTASFQERRITAIPL